MSEISPTEAARNFAGLLDAVEHRGERVTIVRRGKAVARIEPVMSGRGADIKSMLRRHPADSGWRADVQTIRDLVTIDERS